MELNELYREVILDHNRHPRNFGRLDPADALANGHNPLCGDKLTVTLNLQGDVISDLKFDGNGCAISVASASLMTEAVKGRDRSSVSAMFDKVLQMPAYHKFSSLLLSTPDGDVRFQRVAVPACAFRLQHLRVDTGLQHGH